MNIIHINPLKPFNGMARLGDFEEMVISSFADAYSLNNVAKEILSICVHHTYHKNSEPILSDVVTELKTYGAENASKETLCDELCLLLAFADDTSFPEYDIFCDRDGHSLNQLDVAGLKAALNRASNKDVRTFLERMISFSLLF